VVLVDAGCLDQGRRARLQANWGPPQGPRGSPDHHAPL